MIAAGFSQSFSMRHLPLLEPIKGTILVSKSPGIWRMSA
jgi:hypothetical protein